MELLDSEPDHMVTRVMLDNMVQPNESGVDVSMLAEAMAIVGGRVPTEASGNVTLQRWVHVV